MLMERNYFCKITSQTDDSKGGAKQMGVQDD